MNRLRIGEFAKRCRLPVSTLHYYHELGLLEPDEIDPATNYRYYAHRQLAVAVRIAEYRAAGLTPDQIGALLSGNEPETTLANIRAELVADLSLRQERLERLDRLVTAYPVGSLTEPPELAERTLAWASTRSVTASSQGLVRTVRRGFASLRRDSGAEGLLAATFPLDLGEDSFEVELHIEASEAAPTNPPPTRVLRTLHTGDHRTLWIAYDALVDHAQDRHQLTGHVTERYLPPQGKQPRTEVLIHLTEDDPKRTSR